MCNIISIDALFVMYAIGGAFLGWFGMKSYREYVVRKNKSKSKPETVGKEENLSLE